MGRNKSFHANALVGNHRAYGRSCIQQLLGVQTYATALHGGIQLSIAQGGEGTGIIDGGSCAAAPAHPGRTVLPGRSVLTLARGTVLPAPLGSP